MNFSLENENHLRLAAFTDYFLLTDYFRKCHILFPISSMKLNFFKKAWIWKFLPILNTGIEHQKQILWISLFFTSSNTKKWLQFDVVVRSFVTFEVCQDGGYLNALLYHPRPLVPFNVSVHPYYRFQTQSLQKNHFLSWPNPHQLLTVLDTAALWRRCWR